MNIKIVYACFLAAGDVLYNFLPFKRRAKPHHAEIYRAWESSRACFLSRAFNRARRLHTSPKLIPGSAIYVDTYAYIRLTSTNDTHYARTHMHNKHQKYNTHLQIRAPHVTSIQHFMFDSMRRSFSPCLSFMWYLRKIYYLYSNRALRARTERQIFDFKMVAELAFSYIGK